MAGKPFSLRGTVQTNCGYLTKVYAAVISSSGEVVQECSFAPYTASFNLADSVNVQLKFSFLPEGEYIYRVEVGAYNGGKSVTTRIINDSFTIAPDPNAQPVTEEEPMYGVYKAQFTTDESNAGRIWNYFISQFDNPYAAAAILGNIMAESGGNPQIVEGDISGGYFSANYTKMADNGTYTRDVFAYVSPGEGYGEGYGLCQWGGGRKGNLYDFSKSKGKSVGDLDLQLDFIMYEMQTSYPELIEYFKTAPNLSAAVYKFCSVYEQAAVYGARSSYAKQYLEKYGTAK